MAWRKKNTHRIAVSCTLAAVLAIGAADWAWGQASVGGGVGASSGATATAVPGVGAAGNTAGAGQNPSSAAIESQRSELQRIQNSQLQNSTTQDRFQVESAQRRTESGLAGSRAFDQAGTQTDNAAAPRRGTTALQRDTATGSITTDAIMQRRPTSMERRTGSRSLDPRSPRGRAMLGIDLDQRYPATAIVTKVYPGTGADEAGLRVGDVIVSIDNIPIVSVDDVIRVIAETNPNQAVSVGYMRRADTTVHLRPRDPSAADSLSQHGLPPATPRPGSTATPQTQTGDFSTPLPTDPLNREIEEQLRQLNSPPTKP